MTHLIRAYFVFLGASVCSFASQEAVVQSPVSPQDSLRHVTTHPAVRLELVACEPDVVDPVAIAFDERNRMWVAEMSDYPNGPAAGVGPRSRVRLLEDLDGDGRYETSHVFAEKLLFVNGVQPWQAGVILTMAGEVAWLKDTDGDNVADVRETWFKGFVQQNPQLRANHPTFGFDNHIYVANGLRGGTVKAVRPAWAGGAKEVSISGRDFRFNPMTGDYDAISGVGQFGLTFDDHGNRFVCSNRNPCKHIVLPDRYVRRNDSVSVRSTFHDVSVAGADSRVYAINQPWTTSNLHAGQFTAACGVTIYRGNQLPDEFHGNSFTCEPTGGLVHRDVLTSSQSTFVGRRGRPEVEFLASRDNWFRPVNLANGPDGALYVVDMYRAVIEHPQFMPNELKQRPDLRDGSDRGRIYRVVAADVRDRRSMFPQEASSEELVALLENPNAWHRETAARLLFERQDRTAESALNDLASTTMNPIARVHAWHALDGLSLLDRATIVRRLHGPEGPDMPHAIRLAERWTDDATVQQLIANRAFGSDARTRFQCALSLGLKPPSESSLGALAAVALRDAGDPWTRSAVMLSVQDQPAAMFHALVQVTAHADRWHDEGLRSLLSELAFMIGRDDPPRQIGDSIHVLISYAADDRGQNDKEIFSTLAVAISEFAKGLERQKMSLWALLKTDRSVFHHVEPIFEAAIAHARNDDQAMPLRLRSLELLAHADWKTVEQFVIPMFERRFHTSIRTASIRAMSSHTDRDVSPVLLHDFAGETPTIQREILSAILRTPARTRSLLNEIENKVIPATLIDRNTVAKLERHRSPDIRLRARRLMAAAQPAQRKSVVADYQASLKLSGDPARGRQVFAKQCATCHRIGQLGTNVAPDIGDSRNKKPNELLASILDPNRAVDNNYFGYVAVTSDGLVETGIIESETATTVTLKQPAGKTRVLLRRDIEELKSTGLSLMPVGFEKTISKEAMADLISFIKNWRYLATNIPVSSP